jgi:hypothetical protein
MAKSASDKMTKQGYQVQPMTTRVVDGRGIFGLPSKISNKHLEFSHFDRVDVEML